jgi:hypothetical protein
MRGTRVEPKLPAYRQPTRTHARSRRPQRPGPCAAAPPATRQRPDGCRLARSLARQTPGGGQRRVRRPFRALLQAGLWCPAAPLPADTAHRTSHFAVARYRTQRYGNRLRHGLGKPRHLRPHLPRHYGAKSRRHAHRGPDRHASTRSRARLRAESRAAARPHDRSFGEARRVAKDKVQPSTEEVS